MPVFPDQSHTFGGKGNALAALQSADFPVPGWFAIPADEPVDAGNILTALQKLQGDQFAVRSSGTAEDGAAHSFAGQFDTFLHVPTAEVIAKIEAVRNSAQSPSVKSYCEEQGIQPPGVPVVLVQKMIDPQSAGVAFSADPVTGNRAITLISAVEGTGEKLVSGEVDGETWQINRLGEITSRPDIAILTDDHALAVSKLSIACQRHFGRPQDIEWAIDSSGKLWLLQSRPITTLARHPDPSDLPRVWDNSNIAESYGGVTTPLTFSFARRIYESVYREFCVLMSVPASRITKADEVFPQMLGLIRGRTYYNLGSWYRVLALLPGFQVNRSFMEQMMGVKEPLPESLVQAIVDESKTGRFSDTLALVRTCFGLVRRQLGLGKQVREFQQRLDQSLAPPPIPMAEMSGEELVQHYRDLERQLLKRWDAPLVNDFFAMIFYGVLRSLCGKWTGDQDGSLQNELLANTGGIISAEPPRRIIRMAKLAASTPDLAALLADPEITEREKRMALRKNEELAFEFEAYLTDFGDRCLEELKLESPTVRDNAATLLSSIGALAMRGHFPGDSPRSQSEVPKISNPLKRSVFNYVLKQTREKVRCRENLRFERTRLFGRVRSILRELGKRLHADGQLVSADDVFYLELQEILAVWEGTGTILDYSKLAAQRRAEFEIYQQEDPPPDRFQTHGPVHRYAEFPIPISHAEHPLDGDAVLQGMGASPGVVIGKVRVVLDPRNARLESGEILVALQTDPGWVVLFPAASGLLVERGSLLSHSAIVSRELRLPCIVSLPRITHILKTGDVVEMDGTTGKVKILSRIDES